MKMIFFGEAASDSGSLGFSDAWPLRIVKTTPMLHLSYLPSSPNGMNIHSFGNIDNQLDIGIIIIIGTTGHLDIFIGHSDVVRIGVQILWGSHYCELNRSLVAEGFVGPFSYGANLLDGGNTIVGDEYLGRLDFAGLNRQ